MTVRTQVRVRHASVPDGSAGMEGSKDEEAANVVS